MYKYELGMILVPTLSDDEKTDTLNKAEELIETFDGEVTKIDAWGKKRFAYKINDISEGFYYFIQFKADGDTPIEIESRLKIMEPILRHLLVRIEDED